jgi:hypothetical protein
MRFLNDIVENGELEVDHCPWKFITPDAIIKNTREAVHKVHADTIYNGHILPPDYNRSIDRTGKMSTLYWRCVTMSIVLCIRPIVGTTQRLTTMKRRESIVDVDVMGTDSCTMGTETYTMGTDRYTGPVDAGTEPTHSVKEEKQSDHGWISSGKLTI